METPSGVIPFDFPNSLKGSGPGPLEIDAFWNGTLGLYSMDTVSAGATRHTRRASWVHDSLDICDPWAAGLARLTLPLKQSLLMIDKLLFEPWYMVVMCRNQGTLKVGLQLNQPWL